MRLATHNFLRSNVKGTETGYPLLIEPTQVLVESTEVDRDLLERMLPKLDYSAVRQAALQLAPHCEQGLPELPEELNSPLDDALASSLFLVIFNVHVLEGTLTCPDTGRKFPIKDGIPNMILHEDEL